MNISVLLSLLFLTFPSIVFGQENIKESFSPIICSIQVPSFITDSIKNIITDRLTFLGYTDLQSKVSVKKSEKKSILQWSGNNTRFENLLFKGSIIQNASISLVLENRKILYSALSPVVATDKIPELCFINQKPIVISSNDIKKIGYRMIQEKPGQANLIITFSESGKRKMNELNLNYCEKSINYIISTLSSGYQHKYAYFFKCTESISFTVPYMDALLMLTYCKYPVPIYWPHAHFSKNK